MSPSLNGPISEFRMPNRDVPLLGLDCCAGEWEGHEVAVKLISHNTAAEAERVGNEVALSMRFTHPNVVRCLYFEIVTLPPGVEPSGGLPCHRLDDSSSGGSNAMQRRALVSVVQGTAVPSLSATHAEHSHPGDTRRLSLHHRR